MMTLNISRQAVSRRVVFIAILIASGTVMSTYTGAFQYKWGHPRNSITGGYHHAIVDSGTALLGLPSYPASEMLNFFIFGLSSFGSILAIWLIARCELWRSVSGRLRALSYVGFYLLGGTLGDSVQRSLHQLQPNGYPPGGFGFSQPFRWPIELNRIPGTRLDDFSGIFADVLSIASIVWVVFPLWIILGFRLCENDRVKNTKPKFPTTSLLLWVCTFGSLVGASLLLTWWAAPSSYLSNYSKAEAIKDLIFLRIASGLLSGLCVLTIAHAWSFRRRHHVALVLLAILADGLGHHFLYSSVTVIFDVPVPRYDVFSSPTHLYWSYILGRVVLAWAAFGVAGRLGVRFTLPVLNPTPTVTKEAITIDCNGARELAF